MPQLKRMLVVANTDWFIANFMASFLAAHTKAGIQVTAASPRGPHVEALQSAGLDWVEIPMSRGRGSLASNLATMAALRRLRRRTEPDLVHVVTGKAVVLAYLSGATLGDRVVNVLPGLGHAFSSPGPMAALDRWILRWGVRAAAHRPRTLTVFLQSADRTIILGEGAQAQRISRLIPGWGVDLARFAPSPGPAHPPVIMMLSRMLWSKGVGDFVAAARLVHGRAAVRFVLVGDPDPGNPAPVPRRLLEAWQREGVIEWWGRREDVPAVLSQAAVVVLPSRYGEGVPQSLIEAAAMGVPIVASDLPGCREAVEDGINGFLVRPGDSAGLAETALRLALDSRLREEMGARGVEIARRRFATERVVLQYAEIYRELGLETNL